MNIDPDLADMARGAAVVFATLDKFITEYYGPPCPDHEPECACCSMWDIRNEMAVKIAAVIAL